MPRFPLPRQNLPHPSTPLPHVGGGPGILEGMTVLLVEDSRHAAEGLRLICRRLGARMRRAGGVAEARRHLATYRPDLVLVDLGLPDAPGEALIAEVARTPNAPLLIALSGAGDGQAARLSGAQAFLAKPVSVAALVATLRDLLANAPGDVPLPDVAAAPPVRDALALHADYFHAAQLVDGADAAYARGFVASLARDAGDVELAEALAQGPDALRRVLAQRLARPVPI